MNAPVRQFAGHRLLVKQCRSHGWTSRAWLPRSAGDTGGRATRGTLSRALGGVLMLVICGCMNPELESYYGRHEIPGVSASVNGTDVLAGMFTETGNNVSFRRALVTAEMELVDTIVWFPNDYAAPKSEACEWFDDWLYESPGRTLVYVGRDFDAAPLYWKHMKGRVGPDQRRAYQLRELKAKVGALRPTDLTIEQLECDWFAYEQGPTREVTTLVGPWAAGVDPAKTEIQLSTKMTPLHSERLLTSRGDWLVARYALPYWEGSQILLVANGSFLLNLPLVNHENRKLAGKLIAAAGEPRRVVFLESGPGGPPIDPVSTDNSLWTLFGAWPLNAILLQLAVAGVIFCFASWPIFGRPKRPPPEPTSDFAKHVEAVGRLLAGTKDRAFALERVSHVEQSHATASQPAASVSQPGRRRSAPSLPPESKGN